MMQSNPTHTMSSIHTPHASRGSVSPARVVALAALLACQNADDTLDDVLTQACKGRVSDPRDRALAMELVYGVLRRQETLDWRLERFLKKQIGRAHV